MSVLAFDSISAYLAKQYVGLFRKHPVITGIATCVFLGSGLFAGYADSKFRVEEQHRHESLATYSQQLQQLDGVQQNLKDLSEFVSQQRTRLQESEQVVSKLQEEKERIEPLVQADRKVVEAVFQLQELRTAGAASLERWIGFALVIGASLLASFIYSVIVFIWRKAQKNDASTDT